ncbi:MAG: hypothetical protein LBI29_02270 [Rickettsiales bacterium]|nr:hypothetical protein [Rickettsiales bacterium]
MSNKKLKEIFLFCFVLMLFPRAESKGHWDIASVSRDTNSTSIKFSDSRQTTREIVQGQTTSFGASALRSVGNFLDLLCSAFSGKPVSRNYNELGIGNGVSYRSLSIAERTSYAEASVGAVAVVVSSLFAVMGFPVVAKNVIACVGLVTMAGGVYFLRKEHTEADLEIDVQPNGITKFWYSDRKEEITLWPNGIVYEKIFKNSKTKSNSSEKLILFPEKDKYTIRFPNTKVPGKENEGYTFGDIYHFGNVGYSSVSKSLEFTDGDVFRGVPGARDVEGIYIYKNGTVVRDTLRNVLWKNKVEVDERRATATRVVPAS